MALLDQNESTMARDYSETERLLQKGSDKSDRDAQALGYSSHAERMKLYWDRAMERVRKDDEQGHLTGNKNTTTGDYTISDYLLQEMRKDDDKIAESKGYSSHAERMRKHRDKADERIRQRFGQSPRNTRTDNTTDQVYSETDRLLQELDDRKDRHAQAMGYSSHAQRMEAYWDQENERIRQEDQRLRQNPALLDEEREKFIAVASVAEPILSPTSSEWSCNCDGGQSKIFYLLTYRLTHNRTYSLQILP